MLRKYDSTLNTYTTVSSAVFTQTTIGGSAAVKVVYQVADGGPLDQDGIANGVIVDPVGPGEAVTEVLAETGATTHALIPAAVGVFVAATATMLVQNSKQPIKD